VIRQPKALQVDEAIQGLVADAYQTARELLSIHRPVLDKIVATLLEKKVIEGEEFKELCAAEGIEVPEVATPSEAASSGGA